MGYRSDPVASVQEALRAIEVVPYDLVLADLYLPDTDTHDLARRILRSEAASGKHLPIAAMGAAGSTGGRSRWLAAGIDRFIDKPVRAEEFAQAVEVLVLAPAGDDSVAARR